MPRSGPRAVRRYSDEFKLTAVRLSQQPGMLVKTVATALERALIASTSMTTMLYVGGLLVGLYAVRLP